MFLSASEPEVLACLLSWIWFIARNPLIMSLRQGAFIGQHSWINTDKEVLFDRKCKFRALQPWEPGYIKEDVVKDGFRHIAIVEV